MGSPGKWPLWTACRSESRGSPSFLMALREAASPPSPNLAICRRFALGPPHRSSGGRRRTQAKCWSPWVPECLDGSNSSVDGSTARSEARAADRPVPCRRLRRHGPGRSGPAGANSLSRMHCEQLLRIAFLAHLEEEAFEMANCVRLPRNNGETSYSEASQFG